LDDATRPDALDLPGFDFHRLGGKPTGDTIHVNGPCCITLAWEGEDAVRVDLEQFTDRPQGWANVAAACPWHGFLQACGA